MIEYTTQYGGKYNFDYQELKQKHIEYVDMSDKDFLININEALHLACFISFIKGTPTYLCLSDRGIVHQLVHILGHTIDTCLPKEELRQIRELFKTDLELK